MEHPSLELLNGRAYPELAAALRSTSEAIIARWQKIVQENLPSADHLTYKQIRDDLPKVLAQTVKVLESEEPIATQKLAEVSPLHGEARFHQGFRLEELMTEQAILRPIMLEEVTRGLSRPLSVPEATALVSAMDLISRQTVLEYVEHQNRQVAAANEAQSKYLSFLSHDLRGGLNGVCLMIEVLKRELAPEERFKESVDDLDMMRRSIFETIGTMDRFLNAERFRKGKVQVRHSRVNLKHLLMDIVAHAAYQAKDKGVTLSIHAPADTTITSDKDLLTMILQNVTANAIKYGPGAPVSLSATVAEDGTCRMSVVDQGPGIAADKLATLFASFTRGDTQGEPGVGLGLSIARQAANLLGAKLWAESDPAKKGAAFHLELPKVEPKV